jgi:hypothetical protein
MDGGESTSSTTSSIQTLEQPRYQQWKQKRNESEEEIPNRMEMNEEEDGMVLEEDDLASVMSESISGDRRLMHTKIEVKECCNHNNFSNS